MCLLADLRSITPLSEKLGLPVDFYEVDEDGQPTNRAEPGFMISRLTRLPVPEYMCRACVQYFGSWPEARLHITDLK